MSDSLTFSNVRQFRGAVQVPGDKSLTHRGLLLGAMGSGRTVVRKPLDAEDTRSTAECLRQLGIDVDWREEVAIVSGGPLRTDRQATLDCGNSGTTMRLLSGIVAGSAGVTAVFTGDASLSRRPMGRIRQPLELMGAQIEGDHAPLTIHGAKLHGIQYESPVASAQIKSCVLLAGCLAEGETKFSEPAPSRDHTERMLQSLGVNLQESEAGIVLDGMQSWDGFAMDVPGDISSAAFWMVAAAMLPGSCVTASLTGINSTRTGVLDVLLQVGAMVRTENIVVSAGEPRADVTVSHECVRPFEIKGSLVPRLIDEIPVLAVLATQCEGTSVISDAKELRVKESDRIATVCDNLARMGASVEPKADGMVIHGPTPLRGTEVDSLGDHRIGMAFAVASAVAEGETTIRNASSIHSSYPQFKEHFESLSH